MNAPEVVPVPTPIALCVALIGKETPIVVDAAKDSEDEAWREEVETEAKYRAAAKAAADPEAGGVPMMWQKIFTVGHTIQRQLNGLSWIGAITLSASLLSIGWFGYAATAGFQNAIQKAQSQQPVTSLERWRAAPFSRTWEAITSIGKKDAGPAPIWNLAEITKIDWTLPPEVKGNTVTKIDEVPEFVSTELKALAATDKLSPDFDYAELKSIQERWVAFVAHPAVAAPAAADGTPAPVAAPMISVVPRTKQVGDTIWIASFVVEKNQLRPWIGAFHKSDKWSYSNVRIDTINSVTVSGYDTASIKTVPFAMAAAFPEITMLPVPVTKTEGGLK